MSFLRIFGIIIGLMGIFFTFRNYRGTRWQRNHFLMTSLFALTIFLVSLNPNIINFLPVIFDLQDSGHGRLLALMLISIIALCYFYLDNRGKYIVLHRQFDNAIRKMSEHISLPADYARYIKPVMILIPAYNEAENLNLLLKKIPHEINGIEVGCLVVDDGSDDDTFNVVKEQGFLVVRNLINRGQGSASRLGYDILKREGVKVVVTLDADNQHNPDEIYRLITPILAQQSDLVIGSRKLGSGQSDSILRSFGVNFLTRIVNLVSGTKLTDCSSGFKAFSIEALRKIKLYEAQYQSTEVIIQAAKQGLAISEVPISISLRQHGESKKGSNWRYGIRFLKVIIKSWWRQ